MKEDAQKSGIQPVQLQVIENDNLEVKRVYMGMVFMYEDERETIPVIQTTTGLEYEITTKIKKLVDTNKETIAIAKTSSQVDIRMKTFHSFSASAIQYAIQFLTKKYPVMLPSYS